MAPPPLHKAAAVFFVLLVASPSLLQAARTMPSDDQDQGSQVGAETSRATPAGHGTPSLQDALQERPPLLPPPPPPATTIAAGRSRVLGSVPSPGVGH
ncbi:uncharacterized protein LOC133909850 [Phragmites australis]|uniref:uncharacterized protein LOC133909850 n=1 Tax=Phragmites australis TaxID=29695 RepID=UPI002D784B39|nr:uncharacterized protein LOC133909850 [Phragmites australis]